MSQEKSETPFPFVPVPSDRLLPFALPNRDPREHPTWAGGFRSSTDHELCASLYLAMRTKENLLLRKVVDTAAGSADSYPQSSRAALVEGLAIDYEFFGLASGPHETEQLVRDFEAAAVEKLRSSRDKSRG